MNVDLGTIGAIVNLIYANSAELSGFVVPLIADVFNKNIQGKEVTSTQRFFRTFIACILMAIFTKFDALKTGDVEQFMASLGIIFTESQVMYKLYFKDSSLRENLNNFYQNPTIPVVTPAIEKLQTLGKKEENIVG